MLPCNSAAARAVFRGFPGIIMVRALGIQLRTVLAMDVLP